MFRHRSTIWLFGVLALLLAAASRAAAEPEPRWLLPDYPLRAVCTVPARSGATVLVELPPAGVAPGGAVAAFGPTGNPLACRVVAALPGSLALQVQNSWLGREHELTVYYGAPAGTAGTTLGDSLRDPAPILADVYRAGGRSVPNSWPKLFHLYRNAGEPLALLQVPAFGEVNLLQGGWTGGSRRRRAQGQGWIVCFRSRLLVTQGGAHRFALDTADATYLLVDGQVAAARPGGAHPGQEWFRGGQVQLSPGLHRLELYTYCLNPAVVRVGWAPPGHDTLTPLPPDALVAGTAAERVRVERKDRTLHPDFVLEPLPAYKFRAFAPVFIPVRAANRTRNWAAGELTCRWRFGDRHETVGEQALYAFTGAGVHPVTLDVRDTLGFAGTLQRTVDARVLQPVEYPLDVELTTLPAVAYEADILEPQFRIAGRVPADHPLDLWWRVVRPGQADEEQRQRVVPTPTPQRIPLLRAAASELAELHWSLRHWDTELVSGRVRFLRPPFAELPQQVTGQALLGAGGDRLVLLPHQSRGHVRQPPITTEQAFGHVLCIDDSLAPAALYDRVRGKPFDRVLAWIVDGPDWPVVRHETPPPWDASPAAWGPLLKLAWVPTRLEPHTDVVIVSLAREDILGVHDPAVFERHLAALADIVSSTRRVPVVLVTPPPWPPDPVRLKPYAAAVRRVADARSLPVADLYTAFQATARGGGQTFFRGTDLALNDHAQELAAQLLARALLRPGEGED